MKLRNKKTGQIVDCSKFHITIDGEMFDSLAKANEEWEDYKAPVPLIKGKEYIDLFKRWARLNSDSFDSYEMSREKFIYRADKDMLFYDGVNSKCSYGIGFSKFTPFEDLQDGEKYSYYDLVGEERK